MSRTQDDLDRLANEVRELSPILLPYHDNQKTFENQCNHVIQNVQVGSQIRPVLLDVENAEDIYATLEAVGPIDLVVNNAGSVPRLPSAIPKVLQHALIPLTCVDR